MSNTDNPIGNKESISAIIGTYNAEKYLEQVIACLKDFDEIVVCDMESTDSTVEIAKRNGCRVVVFPKGNHKCVEPGREFSLRSARSEWGFVVDADEFATPELVAYLKEFVKNPGDTDALLIARKNMFIDKWLKTTYPDYQLRFFRLSKAHWPPVVHSRPEISGKIDRIPLARHELALVHKPSDVSGLIDRMNRYTTEELARGKKRPASMASMVLQPWWQFVKTFFLKGGWRYGTTGYIQARQAAAYRFYILAKMYEKANDK